MSSDMEIYQPPSLTLAPALPVPPASDIDSWIAVVDDVIKVANAIYDTPFVPEGLRGSVTAVAACILAGREMGIGPMTSLQNIYFSDNQLSGELPALTGLTALRTFDAARNRLSGTIPSPTSSG